jgi:two-component system LytT family response regulator
MQLTAVIVDDEQQPREVLRDLLQQFCPEVVIKGISGNIEDAVTTIHLQRPDILFLDINLGNNATGFDLLDRLRRYNCAVVFVSAHEEYAIKAFEYSAIHYLLKPINYQLLVETIYRIKKKKEAESISEIKQFRDTLHDIYPATSSKIALSDMNKTAFILLDDIVYLESSGSYTIFHLKDKQQYTKSKNLKYFEDSFLDHRQFVRVHKSYIVNKKHIKAYRKSSSDLELLNGAIVPMSIGYRILVEQLGGDFIQ